MVILKTLPHYLFEIDPESDTYGNVHSWQRGPNSPYFMKTPSILPNPFSDFCPTPLPCSLQPPPPLLILLPCFFDWMGDSATFDVLFYLMYYGSAHVESWYVCTLICYLSHTHTHTHTHTQRQSTLTTQATVTPI